MTQTITPAVPSTSPDASTNIGVLANAVGSTEIDTTAGAIGIKAGTVFINGSAALAMTLVSPTAGSIASGGDDGKRLTVIALTSHAHTVTTSSDKINGADDTVTFANAGDSIELVAYNGVWYTVGKVNGTLSEV